MTSTRVHFQRMDQSRRRRHHLQQRADDVTFWCVRCWRGKRVTELRDDVTAFRCTIFTSWSSRAANVWGRPSSSQVSVRAFGAEFFLRRKSFYVVARIALKPGLRSRYSNFRLLLQSSEIFGSGSRSIWSIGFPHKLHLSGPEPKFPAPAPPPKSFWPNHPNLLGRRLHSPASNHLLRKSFRGISRVASLSRFNAVMLSKPCPFSNRIWVQVWFFVKSEHWNRDCLELKLVTLWRMVNGHFFLTLLFFRYCFVMTHDETSHIISAASGCKRQLWLLPSGSVSTSSRPRKSAIEAFFLQPF